MGIAVKSHKGLKGTEPFARSFIQKGPKFLKTGKIAVMGSFCYGDKTCNFIETELHPITFATFFKAATCNKTASEGIAYKPKSESKCSRGQLY